MASYDFIGPTGVIVPDTTDLQADVQQEFRDAFGADLVTDANTPQGVLITAEVLARDSVVRNNVALANQINPNLAGGVFLDAIWALTGGQRFRGSPSIVSGAIVGGQPGTPIPAGSQASVGDGGAIFETVSTVTLGAGGTATVDFQSIDNGAIAAPTSALDTIVTGVLGWETVTNANPATLGQTQETDAASRLRRRNTLALQGTSLTEAILSAVSDVAGVGSAIIRENYTGAPVTIDTVTLAAHSVYVCVDGGTDADVGAALLANKSLGCDWNGTTTVNVTDAASGQVYPVKFQRPAAVPIFMTVTLKSSPSVADPQETVREAIVAYANGLLDGEAGFVVGGEVSPFEIAAAINAAAIGLFVKNLTVGTSSGSQSATSIPITIAQRATALAGNITVNVV